METLFKHLAGTEFDHDQSSHARGGSGNVTLTEDRILDGRFVFESMQIKMRLDAGGFKNRNATDIAERLKDAGADPNDLLALVVNESVLSSPDAAHFIQLSALTVGGVPLPESPNTESLVEQRAFWEERSEALRANYDALQETLLSRSLADDVTVLAIKPSSVGDMSGQIVLTRDPDSYMSEFDAVTLRSNGQWSDNAVTVLGYHAANNAMRNWARTAQGADADAFAAAVKEELGVVADARQSASLLSEGFSSNPYFEPAGPAHEARKALARAMYDNTQEQLKTLFPNEDSFVVYRGANHGGFLNSNRTAIAGTETTQTIKPFDWNPDFPWRESDGQSVSVAMYENNYKPLSSWSLNRNIAADFALQTSDFVAATVVPRERVFSTAFTGNGAFGESEFVILGGKLNIAIENRINERFPVGTASGNFVQDITNFDAYLRARFANDALSADSFITIDGQPVPVFKHLAGTEFDHDQSAHARGGKGASSDLLRYNPPEWQDKRGEEFQAARAAHAAYRSKFLDSVFDNDPLMSNDSSTDGWHRTRDLYVAGREANEDVAVIVNRELRAGAVTPTGAEGGNEWQRVRAFDQMVEAATVKRDFEVFRAAVLTPEQVTALKSGSEFVDAGFQSSDLYEDTAVRYGFSRWAHGGRYQRGYRDDIPVLFRIRLKEGTNAVHVGNNEVVIQRNARVRITSDPADMGPAMRDGTPRGEFDYIGDPDSGYVYSPNFVVVDVEVSK